MQYGCPGLNLDKAWSCFAKTSGLKGDILLTMLFCFVVGFSAEQILCYHNRRSPREERVYGYFDRSAVKSGTFEEQGVFVYCVRWNNAVFTFLS